MKLTLKNHIAKIICFLLTLIVSICYFIAPIKVFASDYVIKDKIDSKTTVLEDMQHNNNFNIEDYPNTFEDEYSFKVVQIAEGTDGCLYLYIYHSSKLKDLYPLTTVNISTTIENEQAGTKLDYKVYNLVRVDSTETLHKYLVYGLEINNDIIRYYDISAIHRVYIEGVDKAPAEGNTISETSNGVAQRWTVASTGNGITYKADCIETIEVTDKFVGFVRYSGGVDSYFFGANLPSCDSHFVAFDTDKPIDKLLEADVYYKSQYHYNEIKGTRLEVVADDYYEIQENYAYLKYDKENKYEGEGWLSGTYEWFDIETSKEFIANNEKEQNIYAGALFNVNVASKINDSIKQEILDKPWVLRFATTKYNTESSNLEPHFRTSMTIIEDVTILRLKFETDGIIYDLGVVDDKTTGSKEPVNDEEFIVEPTDTFKLILVILLLILICVILGPFIGPVINIIVTVIKLPFIAIGNLFKGIKTAIQKNKDKKDKR